MGVFNVSGATAGVNFGTLDIDNWDTAVVNSQTATFWQITPSGQPAWSFTGTGLTYDVNGFPTAGTITFISVNTGSGTWNFNLNATPVSAATLVAAILANDEAAFLGAIFAGNDTITGTTFNDIFSGYAGHDNMRGGLGADTLNGMDGADILQGYGGIDTLNGGNGNDTLTGGADADIFLFDAGLFGADRISDFADGVDHIQFTPASGVDEFSDITVSTSGGWALLTMPDGSTIALTGMTAGQVDASDFIFGP